MTTESYVDPATGGTDDEKTIRLRAKARERVRFPLVLRIFLVTAAIIVLVIALAVGITIQRANAIARTTVNDAITSATSLFKDLERKRLQELKLGALTVSRDPTFFAYIQAAAAGAEASQPEATPPTETAADSQASAEQSERADVASILDQLETRRGVIGSDLMIVTDADGITLARTDQEATATTPDDLYELQPLVRSVIDSPSLDPQTGVMLIGSSLYHAAAAPLNVGSGPTPGFIINAYEVDERFADQIAKTTHTSVFFIPMSGRGAVRSSNAPEGLQAASMPAVKRLAAAGTGLTPRPVSLDNTRYVMTGEPFTAGGKTAGAAIFLRSLDSELAPFRAIEQTLVVAGAIALVLAFLFSWIFSKRLTRPIEQLVDTAQSVTEGNYSIQPQSERSDEVGVLSRAFAQMVTSLRDKAELEELYQQMAARVAERESAAAHLPQSEEGTILVTDLRGGLGSGGDAQTVISRVTSIMKIQEHEIRRQDGVVRAIVGHRLVSVFTGERAILRAIRAARAVCEELAGQTVSATPIFVGAGIATGDFYSGTVELTTESGLALIGNAPLLALLFAWQAPNNHAFISLETAQAAESDTLTSAAREEVKLKWLPNPVTVISFPLTSIGTTMIAAAGTAAMPTMRMDASMPVVAPAPAQLTPGSTFAKRYVIEQVIGRGGMGIVYRALDTQLDEVVAIKTLPGEALARSPEELERFKREIRLARRITHRNVLRTYDYGQSDSVYFISMEYVRGYTLAELLEQNGEMSPRLAMGISRQICRGLEVAHEEGIIHRDIKPQNILVDQKGLVKVMDFGIARMAEASEMTAVGMVVGTPHYMSPEQVEGKSLDPRSDIYSIGVVMYELLTGKRPFNPPSLTAVLAAHLTERPRPPIELRADIGPNVNRIVMKCLEKDPGRRYSNAAELLADLDRVQSVAAAA